MKGDTYVTPKWVYDELFAVEGFTRPWDCAPVNPAFDFLKTDRPVSWVTGPCDIATNPPFNFAEKFVRHALKLTHDSGGKVAMLLPIAWDAAKTRRDLFERPPFKAKYTLTKRIRWENLEQKKAGPSSNHAWYVWDWTYHGKPFMGWLPTQEGR
jgi:hypothetical protein